MTKNEARKHAKEIVLIMLSGRCCPEITDVDDITDDITEQEMIIDQIRLVLERIGKQV